MGLADENEPDYGTYGVRAKRTGDPVNPPPIDRQRLFMGTGGNISPASKGRAKAGGGAMLNSSKPTAFALRKRKV